MIKKIILPFLIIVGFAANAQVIPNATYTDCNQTTKDIHSVDTQCVGTDAMGDAVVKALSSLS